MGKGPAPKPIEDRLWAKVDRSGGPASCWPFNGSKNSHGYGQISVPRSSPAYVHRIAFLAAGGLLPSGWFVLHSCDNPACCNPAHLRAGTQLDNVRDMDQRGRRINAQPKGEACGASKLDAAEVRNIRALARYRKQRAVAAAFGITQANVSSIVRRETWRHLT